MKVEARPPRKPGAPSLDRLEKLCLEKGLRMTDQRRVIARVLSEAIDHPDVDLQDGREKHTYRARVAEGAERAEWWERAVAQYAPYAEYQEKTDREIPLFLLERI